jgi:hypothetical protein
MGRAKRRRVAAVAKSRDKRREARDRQAATSSGASPVPAQLAVPEGASVVEIDANDPTIESALRGGQRVTPRRLRRRGSPLNGQRSGMESQ